MLKVVNSRLSFGARLMVLALMFAVPLTLLTALYVRQSWKDIAFAQREIAGAQYLAAVWPTLDAAARGQHDAAADQALAAAAKLYDGTFGTGEASQALLNATSVADRLEAAASLISQVADASNLTLDPDLDSYYVMDAVTVKLPGLARAAVKAAQASGQPGGDAERIARISAAVDRMEARGAESLGDLTTAMDDNKAGDTRRNLTPVIAPLVTSVAALGERVSSGLVLGAPPSSASAEQAALQDAVNTCWRAANQELIRLLEARVDGFMQGLILNLVFVVAFLGFAAVAGWVITRAFSRRLGDLLKAMEAIAAGNLDSPVPHLADRNETGRIAAGVQTFKEASQVKARLETEAAEQRRQAEAGRAEADAERSRAIEEQSSVVEILASELARLAKGDLTRRIDHAFPAQYESLRRDFNTAVRSLQDAMRAIASSVAMIDNGAREISSATGDLSRRTEQQAASLEETAAVIEQITVTVQKTAHGARKAAASVGDSRSRAESSTAIVRDAVSAMSQIEQSAEQIGQIISVIDEIAFQTNLLALNAGVEAARAGDAGKGFAVVASEVRALAQRSAEAAKEIKSLINASAAEVGNGVGLVGRTGEVLGSIADSVADIDTLVQEIAVSAQQQAEGLTQVNITVNQMDQMTQQNAAMVEQTTAASHSLADEVRGLVKQMDRFQIGGESSASSALAA